MRASLTASIVRRSFGSKCESSPAPPETEPPSCEIVDLARDDDHVRALVDLMRLQLLAGGQLDRDRAGLGVGAQHLRMVSLDL